jgi:hypothetical protein
VAAALSRPKRLGLLTDIQVVSDSNPSKYICYYVTIHRLCKICGFHGADYEEWRHLGYKNPVRTSQETQYVSATESSQLMLCKI